MSIMIAVRHNGRIALAADSQWSAGWDDSRRIEPKIRQRGNTMVTVGPASGAGIALQRELLRFIADHGDNWPEEWPEHCLAQPNEHLLRRMTDSEETAPVLVVWNGRIFEVRCDGGLFEPADDVAAIGCGKDYATGAALAYLERYETARTVAIKAAEVACKCSAGCGLPIICETVSIEGGG